MTERVLIYLAFNIFNFTAAFSSILLLIVALCLLFINRIPTIISYSFWFSLGALVFSLIFAKAKNFLNKKYDEQNEYYLTLLKKRGKQASKLKVIYKKDKAD